MKQCPVPIMVKMDRLLDKNYKYSNIDDVYKDLEDIKKELERLYEVEKSINQ